MECFPDKADHHSGPTKETEHLDRQKEGVVVVSNARAFVHGCASEEPRVHACSNREEIQRHRENPSPRAVREMRASGNRSPRASKRKYDDGKDSLCKAQHRPLRLEKADFGIAFWTCPAASHDVRLDGSVIEPLAMLAYGLLHTTSIYRLSWLELLVLDAARDAVALAKRRAGLSRSGGVASTGDGRVVEGAVVSNAETGVTRLLACGKSILAFHLHIHVSRSVLGVLEHLLRDEVLVVFGRLSKIGQAPVIEVEEGF